MLDYVKDSFNKYFTDAKVPSGRDFYEGLSDEEKENTIRLKESVGAISPIRDGALTEFGEGVASGFLQSIGGVAKTITELTGNNTLEDKYNNFMSVHQGLNAPEDYKVFSSRLSDLARTAGNGLGNSLASIGTTAAASFAGGPAAGFAAGFATTFSQTYGDNVRGMREMMPGADDDTIRGAALISSVVESMIEQGLGPQRVIANVGKRAAIDQTKNAVKSALRDSVKRFGVKRVTQFLTEAAKGGAEEGAEEILQYVTQKTTAKMFGGENVEFDPRDMSEQAFAGFLGGMLTSAGVNTVTGGDKKLRFKDTEGSLSVFNNEERTYTPSQFAQEAIARGIITEEDANEAYPNISKQFAPQGVNKVSPETVKKMAGAINRAFGINFIFGEDAKNAIDNHAENVRSKLTEAAKKDFNPDDISALRIGNNVYIRESDDMDSVLGHEFYHWLVARNSDRGNAVLWDTVYSMLSEKGKDTYEKLKEIYKSEDIARGEIMADVIGSVMTSKYALANIDNIATSDEGMKNLVAEVKSFALENGNKLRENASELDPNGYLSGAFYSIADSIKSVFPSTGFKKLRLNDVEKAEATRKIAEETKAKEDSQNDEDTIEGVIKYVNESKKKYEGDLKALKKRKKTIQDAISLKEQLESIGEDRTPEQEEALSRITKLLENSEEEIKKLDIDIDRINRSIGNDGKKNNSITKEDANPNANTVAEEKPNVDGEIKAEEETKSNENKVGNESQDDIVSVLTKNTPSVDLNVSEINSGDERIPNFKSNANRKTGVVSPLNGMPIDLVSNPIVVMEFNDGEKHVVTGRHRLDLYKRAGRETIPARVIREVDGYTIDDAKFIDAVSNIVDEKGTVKDYLDFFNSTKISDDDVKKYGITSREKGRAAYSIYKNASRDLIDDIDFDGNGEPGKIITPSQAAIIAENLPIQENSKFAALQNYVANIASKKRYNADVLRHIAKKIHDNYGKARSTSGGLVQLDLFTDEESMAVMNEYEREAKARVKKSYEFKQIANNIRTALTKNGKLEISPKYESTLKDLGVTDIRDAAQLERAYEKALYLSDYWLNGILSDEDNRLIGVAPSSNNVSKQTVQAQETPVKKETLNEEQVVTEEKKDNVPGDKAYVVIDENKEDIVNKEDNVEIDDKTYKVEDKIFRRSTLEGDPAWIPEEMDRGWYKSTLMALSDVFDMYEEELKDALYPMRDVEDMGALIDYEKFRDALNPGIGEFGIADVIKELYDRGGENAVEQFLDYSGLSYKDSIVNKRLDSGEIDASYFPGRSSLSKNTNKDTGRNVVRSNPGMAVFRNNTNERIVNGANEVKSNIKNQVIDSDTQWKAEAEELFATARHSKMSLKELDASVADLIVKNFGSLYNFGNAFLNNKRLSGADPSLISACKMLLNDEETMGKFTPSQREMIARKFQKGIASLAGQSLNSLRLRKADPISMNVVQNAINDIIDRLPSEKLERLKDKYGDEIYSIVDRLKDSPDEFDKFLTDVYTYGSSIKDKAYEFWINSILSGFRTHVNNSVGNIINTSYELLAKRPAQALVSIMSKAMGKEGQVELGELKQLYKGLAWRHAYDAFKDAIKYDVLTPDGKFDEGSSVAIGGKLGRIIRIPTRFLRAADYFVRALAHPAEASAYAYRIGVKNGLKGDALNSFIERELSNQNSKSNEYANRRVKEITFTEDLDGAAKAMADLKNRSAIFGYIFPFIKTPYNLLRQGIRKSPAGILNLAKEAYDMKQGRFSAEIFDEHLAEQVVAWGLSLMLYGMLPDDETVITGTTGYRNGSSLDRFKMANEPPMSIKIGGRWFSYERLEPVSTVFAILADSLNAMRGSKGADEFLEASRKTASSVGKIIAEKSYLQSIRELVEVLQDPEKNTAEMFSSFAASWVPNAYRQAAQAIQDNVPDYRNRQKGIDWLNDYFGATISRAGLVNRVPKLDWLGRPIRKDDMEGIGKVVFRMLSPMQMRAPYSETIDSMLVRWNSKNPSDAYYPNVPTIYLNQDKTIANNYTEYCQMRGKYAQKMISSAIRNGEINVKNPTERDINTLKNILSESTRMAKKWAIDNNKYDR